MNTQERDQLNQFLKQLIEVKLTEKNTEAETMIREAATRQPDAAYLLVQRSMLLEQALNEAKTQISALQNQLQQSSSASSTGRFFGNDPWAQAPFKASAVSGAGNYQIPAAAAASTGAGNAPFSQVAPQTTGSGVGSFLGNVATTAAGVVAGSFLFQGIENLMGHHQSGWGQQPLGEQMTENTVINNYYSDSDQPEMTGHGNDFMASNESDSFFEDNGGFFDGGDGDSDWV
ncbi:MAG: DUF2076 domain-containing protein [Methylobacter sp.]